MAFPRISINNTVRRYSRVGRCIYALDDAPHRAPYDIEHIIPISMEGRLELPGASCRDCAKMIGKFETPFFRGTMETARDHIGLRGRQKIKRRRRLPVRLMSGATLSIAREDHPSVLILPKLLAPGFMLGMRPGNEIEWAMNIAVSPAVSDLRRRTNRIGAPINMTGGLDALDCYRQIAKIAHSFAVAELRPEGITPFLLNLIHGVEPMLAGYLVGCSVVDEPLTNNLHEVNFHHTPEDSRAIVVRVRLFAYIENSPTYYALAGIRPVPMPAPQALDQSDREAAVL